MQGSWICRHVSSRDVEQSMLTWRKVESSGIDAGKTKTGSSNELPFCSKAWEIIDVMETFKDTVSVVLFKLRVPLMALWSGASDSGSSSSGGIYTRTGGSETRIVKFSEVNVTERSTLGGSTGAKVGEDIGTSAGEAIGGVAAGVVSGVRHVELSIGGPDMVILGKF